ncbi:hypothetical protein [Rubellicoccus peritrichatus]|uniref:Uncharacterized protein n=1 Tax=Rubellicoccus peritrichatus TaxID=3080537 RepID=A0AAQ3LCR5_9BACT|nr:hypothetical protein [Puniceicoccus sp. CR14]WOO43401.1 hypothetical protein RZN69_09900 [Puniceicoccus sp. CR14]
MNNKCKIAVFVSTGILTFALGYFSYDSEVRETRIEVVPAKQNTIITEKPQQFEPTLIDEETKKRWQAYDDVEALGSFYQRDQAFSKFRYMLAADAYDTFERIAALPEGHPGEEELHRLLVEYLASTNISQTGYLLEMLKGNSFLYEMTAVGVASVIAQNPLRDNELFQWWSIYPDNIDLAYSTSSAVVDIIRRHESSEEVIIANYERTMALPSGPVRSALMRNVLSTTYPDRFEIAQQLLLRLPQDSEFDDAVGEFAFYASQHDPATSMEWAFTIKAEDARRLATVSIANNWASNDQSSFESWFAENSDSLDEDTLIQIQETVWRHERE